MSENTYFDMNRRSFLKSTAAAGALVLGTYFIGSAPRAMAGVLAKPADNAKRANLFIALRPDGMVEVTCHRSEMGQQIRTAIAQIVADEMEAAWDKVIVIQGKGALNTVIKTPMALAVFALICSVFAKWAQAFAI